MIIKLPPSMRRLAGGQATIREDATTVGELLDRLDERFAGLAERVRAPDGAVKRHINIFVNGREIRSLHGLATPLGDSDEVVIAAAMAGG